MHAVHRGFMAKQGITNGLPGRDIPHQDCSVGTARGQNRSIRAERHRKDPIRGAGQGITNRLADGHIPQQDGRVKTPRSQEPPIRTEGKILQKAQQIGMGKF